VICPSAEIFIDEEAESMLPLSATGTYILNTILISAAVGKHLFFFFFVCCSDMFLGTVSMEELSQIHTNIPRLRQFCTWAKNDLYKL